MKKLFTPLMLSIIIAIMIYAGSPYYTAYQLKNAYEAKEGAAIAKVMDFEQLRPNIASQLTTRFSQTLLQYPMVAQLGGEALTEAANGYIIQAVEGAMTPSNIEGLVQAQGQVNQSTKELVAAWAIASNQVDLRKLIQQMIVQSGDVDAVVKALIQQMMDKQAEQIGIQAQTGADYASPDLSYCALDCFKISSNFKGYPVTIEMQRQGLIDWKIVNVLLP